jgi:hypothetical protein
LIGLIVFLVATQLYDKQQLWPALQNFVWDTKPLIVMSPSIPSTTAITSFAIHFGEEEEPPSKRVHSCAT